jgi:hypothetical protein
MPVPPEPPRLVNARRFLMSFTTNQLDDVVNVLSPEVTYTVPGRSALSGVFHGPEEVRQHLAALMAFSNRTFDVLKWVDWMVGESHVAALQYAQVQGHGMIYRGHHLFVVQSDHNDALVDIRVFFEDQEQANRFFTQ